MIREIPVNRLNLLLLLSVIFLVTELLSRGAGMLLGVGILLFMVYLGWKEYESTFGKVICWIGVIGLIIQVLSLFAVGFFIIGFLILLVLEYRRQQKQPPVIQPETAAAPKQGSGLVESGTLLPQKLIGRQSTGTEPYQWRDIHIQTGIGSKTIDLSNTVVHGTAVVSVRHIIGQVTVLVPYEMEVQVLHSALYGSAEILGERKRLLNESISLETPGYAEADVRVKIMTSVMSGELEVRRI
ncbi:cell wall-active antibiotics response protein LiaF [Alkalicoccus luteus]|uniref:cell wall-active antibiotics response protein LiaF n=1 Tax=Alkalicoccus luteus TaxID=1237094 RepID=UPI0040343D71